MTVANPFSRRFGAFKVGDMIEQRVTDVFLKNGFALDVVDSCQRGF